MKYTKEELINLPLARLIDIIIEQENTIDSMSAFKGKYDRLVRLLQREIGDEKVVTRKPATPESRALSYERQKARQREKYREMRALKKGAE